MNTEALLSHGSPFGNEKSTNTWIPASIISCGPPPTLKKTAKRLQSYDFSKQSSFTFHTSPFYLDFLILDFRFPPPSQLQPPTT